MPPRSKTLPSVAALILVSCLGCEDKSRPVATRPAVPPGTLTPPPLQAWVVLHTEDDGVGFENNWGSRLTLEELTAYMNNLLGNASGIFGTEASFTWNPGQLHFIRINPGPKTQDRRMSGQASVNLMNALTLTFNDPNAINIYFAGWIQHPTDGPWEQVLAYTVDPGHVGQGYYAWYRPFILFNDDDWNTGVHQPAKTNKLYLEHEMGHYLLRDAELNYAYWQQTGKGLYDPQEHFIAWPSGVNTNLEKQHYEHLMKAGIYRDLFPRLDALSKEHAYYRFYDSRWKQP